MPFAYMVTCSGSLWCAVKSLLYNKKSVDPKTEPRGTPAFISKNGNCKLLTLCFLSVR